MCEYQENDNNYQMVSGKILAITTPQGRLILGEKPYHSLIRFIEYIGIETVATFDLKAKDEMPLVSKTRFTLRDYQPASDGWFVYTTMNLKDKFRIVEEIGKLVGQHFVCATRAL